MQRKRVKNGDLFTLLFSPQSEGGDTLKAEEAGDGGMQI